MSPAFWAWVTDHWFLSFIMAIVILRIVSRTLKTILAPLKRFAPQEPPPAPEEEAEEEELEPEIPEPAESDERAVQGVVVPIRRRRSRFDRI